MNEVLKFYIYFGVPWKQTYFQFKNQYSPDSIVNKII